jgi:Fic family protein
MADWDKESPQLRRNLAELLRRIRDDAAGRSRLNVDSVRAWHVAAMRKLTGPMQNMAGRFRGEQGLERVEVRIGGHFGIAPAEVAGALAKFDETLKDAVAQLDQLIPTGIELSADELAAVLDVCAWAHAQWVWIHPFANGNGRTARLLANALAMRYGLPPFVRLRPRPGGGYGDASKAAMQGDWQATVGVFREMLKMTLSGTG